MRNSKEKTEYILLPLSIYLKFFKDVKLSGKQVSAVLNEAEIRRQKRKSINPERPESKPKKRKTELDKKETVKGSESEHESGSESESDFYESSE